MKNATIIVLCNQSWDWSADYCRQTARVLSKQHNVFCYLAIDPIRFGRLLTSHHLPIKRENKHLILYRPVQFIPFQRYFSVRHLNEKMNMFIVQAILFVNRWNQAKTKIVWSFDQAIVGLVSYFTGFQLLYDCVDYVWHSDKITRKQIQQNEISLIRKSSWMCVNSQALAQIHKDKRDDIFVVPLGFRLPSSKRFVSQKQGYNKKIRVGLVGVIDYRIDFDLLSSLARRNPNWEFVLWGAVHAQYEGDVDNSRHIKLLESVPNIIFQKPVEQSMIFDVISQFTICMIPYRTDMEIVRLSYPMKIFEYFNVGKPVVSTPIQELYRFKKYIKIGRTVEEWERNIRGLLRSQWPRRHQAEQHRLAVSNSWENKIDAISHHIEKSL